MSFKFEFKSVSVSNFLEKREEENEDFIDIKIQDNYPYARFSLCDGAGGAGVFCREWATYLALNVPLNPYIFDENTKKWFNNISKSFYDEVIEKKDLSDLILNKKVYRDGSYSTLTAFWIDNHENKLFFSSAGDSCVFLFEKANEAFELKYVASVNEQNDIDDAPYLLNWLFDLNIDLPFHTHTVSDHFVIIMASDSLAKWIILCLTIINQNLIAPPFFNENFFNSINNAKYNQRKESIFLGNHNIKNLDTLFEYLRSISFSSDIFKSEMQNLYLNNEIDIDDYSLIFLEGHVS